VNGGDYSRALRPRMAAMTDEVKPLTDEMLVDFEKQADEIVRELTENPHTVAGSETELKSNLALMVKRLVAEVRRQRQQGSAAHGGHGA
jgi:hypothetical protein